MGRQLQTSFLQGLVVSACDQRVLWAGPCSTDSGEEGQEGQSQWGLQPSMGLLAYGVTLLLDEADQPIGGRIMRGHWAVAIKLRLNFLSQLLSQLHSVRKRRKNGVRKVPVLVVKSTSTPHPLLESTTHPHWSKLLMSQMMP